ncbi:DUF1194 domain-containing protein [Mesobacterium pallidum]|uniref:DUF1194 domain-containing protein n=1 Tax=Mesobacterium pallidum TaxID=2872037 RepID=UPI001EE25E83|nr:DUF1194 domain-containing protein [Mesobacterium pallidum]
MGQHGKHRALVGLALATALVPGAAAAQVGCRLALLLALDISSSVNAEEDTLQRSGLASALIAPEVQEAFLGDPLPVALAAYEWSGRHRQAVLLDWVLVDSAEDLLIAAQQIGRSERSTNNFPTALGYALGYGATMLRRAPPCLWQVIDVSGDGKNNEGFGPEAAYREFPFAGVTVNGLVINAAEFEAEVDLIDYYRTEVLRGPGAFIEVAQGFEDYERAMRRKLLRELRSKAVGGLDGPDLPGPFGALVLPARGDEG